MLDEELYTYKLYVYYKDTKVVRHFYFQTLFSCFRFTYKQLHKEKVDSVRVVRINV